MKSVLLVNGGKLPHYRVAVYNYLSGYLGSHGYDLTVLSEGIEQSSDIGMRFRSRVGQISARDIVGRTGQDPPDAIILWVKPGLRTTSLAALTRICGVPLLHWGHRRPMGRFAALKRAILNTEHAFDDAIILYSSELLSHIERKHRNKAFVANNTLDFSWHRPSGRAPQEVKRRFGISTAKNIICMGRLQRRKRIDELVKAFQLLKLADTGLILAGPDTDDLLSSVRGESIFKVGAVYGAEGLELLAAADVCCIPGAIGLSIVDAMYCGLPVVTYSVTHGPEIMYLKDGVNGFIVPTGDIEGLANRLALLLTDDSLRSRFSDAARREIATAGHIDRLCEGFLAALDHALRAPRSKVWKRGHT